MSNEHQETSANVPATLRSELPDRLDRSRTWSTFNVRDVKADRQMLQRYVPREMLIAALRAMQQPGDAIDEEQLGRWLENLGIAHGGIDNLYEAVAKYRGSEIGDTIRNEVAKSTDRNAAIFAAGTLIVAPFERDLDDRKRTKLFEQGREGIIRIMNDLDRDLPTYHQNLRVVALLDALDGVRRDVTDQRDALEESSRAASDPVDAMALNAQRAVVSLLHEYIEFITAHFRDMLAAHDQFLGHVDDRRTALERESEQLLSASHNGAWETDIILGNRALVRALFEADGRDAGEVALDLLRRVLARPPQRHPYSDLLNSGIDRPIERAWLRACADAVSPMLATGALTLMTLQYAGDFEQMTRTLATTLALGREEWSHSDPSVVVHGLVITGPREPEESLRRLRQCLPKCWSVLGGGSDDEVRFFVEEIGLQTTAVKGVAQAVEAFLGSGDLLLPIFDAVQVLGVAAPNPESSETVQ
jgi:hypothetical protein